MHSQLSHPNIIRLIGVAREWEGGPPMMVLPFMEQGSLEDYYGRGLSLDLFAKVVSTNCSI